MIRIKPYFIVLTRTVFLFSSVILLSLRNSFADDRLFPGNGGVPVDLGSIFVSAKRTGSGLGDAAENTVVFTQDDIAEFPARNLGEILSYIPGVQVQVNNRFGQSTGLSIHGSDSYQVLLMIDGIPFNTQLSGQANPSLLPVGNIERIEVIRGAASSVWGSSLGGVVNVITKDVGDSAVPKGKFTTSFAEFSTTKNSLELSGTVKKAGYFLEGSYFETDGIKSKSDADETKVFGKVAYPLDDASKVLASFGYSGGRVLNIIPPNNEWYDRLYQARYGQTAFDHKTDISHFTAAYKYNHQNVGGDTYNATTDAFKSSSKNRNLYQGISLNESLQVFDDDLLVVGADFDWHALKSNNYLAEGKSIGMQAPYMNYTLKWGPWDLIPGVRYDHNGKFGSQTSPSFGMVYHFQDARQSLVRGKISRAFNAPPLMWIYNEDSAWSIVPNPDMKAERAILYEIGYETKIVPSMSLEANLYRSDIEDAITWVTVGSTLMRDNVRKFRRQGVETILRYEMNERVDLYSTAAFNDSENRVTKTTHRDDGIARQSFSLGGNYKSNNGFVLNLSGRYNRWSSPASSQPNDRKFIFDAKIKQTIKNAVKSADAEVFLNIYNLANSKYWASITSPTPERYFEGGFSIIF